MSEKKYLSLNGLTYFSNKIKSIISNALDGKSDVGHTHTSSDITDLPDGLVVDSTLDGTSSNAISNSAVSDALDGKSDVGHTHTSSDITDLPSGLTVDTTLDGTSSNAISNSAVSNALDGLSTVATSGSYNDLSNKPTIPTYSAGTNLSLNDTTFNVSSTPSFTNITIGGYTITIE